MFILVRVITTYNDLGVLLVATKRVCTNSNRRRLIDTMSRLNDRIAQCRVDTLNYTVTTERPSQMAGCTEVVSYHIV